mmetsp:Transcript_4637/g.19863  ORF Transcript_4637/g.19863 Transcript_4637/m.19863 type:complete len:105 (-) Transcript_4637:844-1158(-)
MRVNGSKVRKLSIEMYLWTACKSKKARRSEVQRDGSHFQIIVLATYPNRFRLSILTSCMHFFDSTLRLWKAILLLIAVPKPSQLNDTSFADASVTPATMGSSDA